MVGPKFAQSLIVLLSAVSTVSSATTSQRSPSGWPRSLANSVHDSSWPEFAIATDRWSSYEAPTFDRVFLPRSEEALSAGLKYLTRNNIPFLTKSGGHGYSTTLSLIQDGVMINMENFNYSRVNRDLTATIGSGASFNDLVKAIGGAGREINVGSCPCVGATGAMLGGGVGRLQGLHGLTSDAVRKIRMVLWNGTIVEASDNVNQDLFWGMRGAGQNFGVVIETTFKTFPATNGGMHYEADLIFSLDSLGALIDTVNSMIPLHPALSLIVLALADPVTLEIVVVLNLVYAGTMKKGQKYTEKFTPFSLSLTESMIAWVDLPTKSAGGAVVAQCATGKRQDMHGMLTKYLHKPSFIEMFNDFASFIKAYPAANASGLLIETFAQQGVDALPDNYDAFPHRGKLNNFIEIDIVYVDDSVAEVGDAWAKKWRDYFAQPTISGYDKWFVYQNYGHGDEPPSVLYGYDEWRHKRLTALKNTYDPHGVFNAFHAIPSDLASWT